MPSRTRPPTAAGAARPCRATRDAAATCEHWSWPPGAGQRRPSPGATAPARRPGNPTAAMTSRFLALRVRPANRDIPRAADGTLPECWLLAEWPPGTAEPTDYWLSNLPADTPLPTWSAWPRSAGGSNTTTANSKTGLGPGPLRRPHLHRLAPPRHPRLPAPRPSAPCCASTQKPLRRPDPLRGPPRAAETAGHLDRRLLDMRPTHPHTRTPPPT